MFLRGHGSQVFNSGGYGNVAHVSGGLGQVQGDAIRNITGHIQNGAAVDNTGGVFIASGFSREGTVMRGGNPPAMLYFDASRVVPVAGENRPVNQAVRYLIRAAM